MPNNPQWKLAARPVGLPKRADFTYDEPAAPDPGDGEFVVRNRFISLDPAMRGWMNAGKSYIPAVEIGEVMRAISVGEVVASNHDGFAVGDHVQGVLGMQTFAVSDGSGGVTKVDPSLAPLPKYLSVLGMPGMTAYFCLLRVGQPQAGETVVISAAAGAVGSVAGQIAKLKGCRVVGLAGGPDKCAYVTDTLGFDACIDYKQGDVAAALKQHCPDGIDVYFDNVGGEILEAVMTRLAMRARIAVCGAISQYNNTEAPRGPANYMSLLVHRARMEGFVVFDWVREYGQAAQEMAGWMAAGKLQSQEDIVEGIDQFPDALLKLFSGDKRGKLVLQV